MKRGYRAVAVLVAGVLLSAGQPAKSRTSDAQMMELDPAARIEQRCNERAMGMVGREHKNLRPDELVAYAYANPAVKNNSINAPGAAVRSGDTWYHLSYRCVTTDDGLKIKSFSYTLGSAVPEAEWSEHYLVPP